MKYKMDICKLNIIVKFILTLMGKVSTWLLLCQPLYIVLKENIIKEIRFNNV